MIQLNKIYNEVYNTLVKNKITSAQVETEIILTKLLNISKTEIYTYPETMVSKEKLEEIKKCLLLRLANKPLAYIFNEKEFFGISFYVNEDVFIPRQETEFVVEESLMLIKEHKLYTCADIGTGCGNIAISIIKNIDTEINMYAVDVSEKALSVAIKNAKLHSVYNKINFILSDKLEYFLCNGIKLDLIVSNPPYVTEEEYKNLQPEIYFEPKLALLSPTGLEFYEYFAENGKSVLNKNGYFILEINPNLVKEICNLFEKQDFKIEKIIYDYNKLPRAVVVCNIKAPRCNIGVK